MRISDSDIEITKNSKFHKFLYVEGSVSAAAVVVAASLKSATYEIHQNNSVSAVLVGQGTHVT